MITEAAVQACNPTLTTDALAMLRSIAKEAERDIAQLPEGSQPFWFRTRATK